MYSDMCDSVSTVGNMEQDCRNVFKHMGQDTDIGNLLGPSTTAKARKSRQSRGTMSWICVSMYAGSMWFNLTTTTLCTARTKGQALQNKRNAVADVKHICHRVLSGPFRSKQPYYIFLEKYFSEQAFQH
jgi:hypothetical protein